MQVYKGCARMNKKGLLALTAFIASGVLIATQYKDKAAPEKSFTDTIKNEIKLEKDKPDKFKVQGTYASVVMNALTGEILHGDGLDEAHYPASLVKLMTVFLAFEEIELGRLKMDDKLSLDKMLYEDKGIAALNVKPTDDFTVEMALKGIVTRSAADCTDMLAEKIAGSKEAFVERMNRRAESLGMLNTNYMNPSGLHHPKQVGTARDYAILMRALIQYFPELCEIFQTKEFFFRIPIKNHALIPGADMGKTGQTDAAGYNTFLSFPKGHNRYIVGVFGGKSVQSRNQHARELFLHYSKADTVLAVSPEGKLVNIPVWHDIRKLPPVDPLLVNAKLMDEWQQNLWPEIPFSRNGNKLELVMH